MREVTNGTDEHDGGWLPAFLAAFAIGALVIAGLTFLEGLVLPGLLAIGVAILFFTLRRLLERQRATTERLQKLESELESRPKADS